MNLPLGRLSLQDPALSQPHSQNSHWEAHQGFNLNQQLPPPCSDGP